MKIIILVSIAILSLPVLAIVIMLFLYVFGTDKHSDGSIRECIGCDMVHCDNGCEFNRRRVTEK